ncbi:MAG TPA: beta-ketoacyl-[acyl-carrier-protein] synthase family protein [Mycobacteriales bacterium]
MTSVAVTGLGATTPVGGTVGDTWAGVLSGASGTSVLEGPEWEQLPVRLAARAAVDPLDVLDRVEARRLDRGQQLALVAAREAWADAGAPDVDPERLAVVVGSGVGGVTTLLDADRTLREKGARRVGPLAVTMLLPNGPAVTVGLEVGAKAGVHAPVSACATGAEAIAQAADLIRLGRADVVVCGGAEAAVHPLPIAGFAAMRALSTRDHDPAGASRPYDKGRDGFVLGEGAGVLVLESLEHARARGARIHGFLLGSGVTSDAYHVAAPDPTGDGAARAVTAALRDADVAPADIVHVNAHATSTPLGDIAELAALRTALGADLDQVAVSATKASTGHLLGAAGAVEAIFAVRALTDRTAPPNRNLDDPDDDIGIDVVGKQPRGFGDGLALSTSFGFGGHDVALIFAGGSER